MKGKYFACGVLFERQINQRPTNILLTVGFSCLTYSSSASDEASVQSDEDGFQEEIDDLEDSASEASDEGSDELEESFSADEAVEETSNQDEPSDAASNCSDADDETSGEQSDEEQEEGGRVIVDWGQHTGDSSHCLDNVEYSTGLVTKVSGNASDNDSVSAEQIQDFIEKPETTDIVSKSSAMPLLSFWFTIFVFV